MTIYGNLSPQTKKYFLLRKYHVLLFIYIKIVLLSSPNNKIETEMFSNTTANLDKVAHTDYVDFGKCQERFARFSWTRNDSNYLDSKLKVFKREDKNAGFRLRQNLSMGKADFSQFMRQRNQLVVAADNFLREQNLSPVLQSTMSKDMEEQLKLVHKMIDVVDRPNRRICVTLLRYKGDNPKNSYAQVRLFGRKKEEEKFQQIVYVNYKLDKFVQLLDVTNSMYDKVIAKQPICIVFLNENATFYYNHLFFLFESA